MDLPTDRSVESLMRLYRAAEAQVARMLEQSIASGNLGTARYRAVRLAAIRQLLSDLQDQAVPEATRLIAEAYTIGGQVGGLSGEFGTGIHQDAVEVLADNVANRLNEAAEKVGRDVEDVFRKEGLRHAALDIVQAGTQRQSTQALRDALLQQGQTAFVDRAGRQWGLERYASMVIRTTTREAVSTATKNTLVEKGEDLVTISSHRHDPDVCDDYDGRTFSLTGRTPGYPVLDRLPPFHPNCRHVLTPAAESFEALERELGTAPAEPPAAAPEPPVPPAPAAPPPTAPAAGAPSSREDAVAQVGARLGAALDDTDRQRIAAAGRSEQDVREAYDTLNHGEGRPDLFARDPDLARLAQDIAQRHGLPVPPDAPFSQTVQPMRDADSPEREDAQTAVFGDGPLFDYGEDPFERAEIPGDVLAELGPANDPGEEAGAREAWAAHVKRDAARANRELNVLLGKDLAKFIDRKWGREQGIRRQLLEGDMTVEQAEELAYEEYQRLESRRLGREIDAERESGYRSQSIPCFSCGHFKRRPSDICGYCGDDPVSMTAAEYYGGETMQREVRMKFDREYGFSGI